MTKALSGLIADDDKTHPVADVPAGLAISWRAAKDLLGESLRLGRMLSKEETLAIVTEKQTKHD
jgi:hypothetical protein